jgi:hypothetical protein
LKYQSGDDIIILHTQEEGKVVEVLNEKMLLVEVRGVRFPAYVDQIDFPYYHRFVKKQKEPPKKPVKKYIENLPKEKNRAFFKQRRRHVAFTGSKIYAGRF